MDSKGTVIIRVRNITVRYPDGTPAISDLSFEVREGECVALAGANGAGKTSLLLTMVGILPIHAGTLTIDGIALGPETTRSSGVKTQPGTLEALRRKTGLVFQNPEDQLFMPSIYDDLAFGPRNMGLEEQEVRCRVDAALSVLGISHLRNRSPLKLSGGEKRLAAIATVLSMEPAVMLFDEPTAFLDPRARRSLIHTLASLPHTKLIATHDLAFAAELCERALILKEGCLCGQGRTGELFRESRLMEECGLEAIP
jgi:cobalt/nickel transport system ATP-binding protein